MKIIFRKKSFFFNFFKSNNIYTTKINYGDSKKVKFIDDSIYDASEYRKSDNLSGDIVNKLYKNFIKKNDFQFIMNWGGEAYKEKHIKHSYLKEIRKIINELRYAEKVIKKYDINEKVYLWPSNISVILYFKLIRLKLIDNKIRIHPLAIVSMSIYEIIKSLFFLSKLFFFIEYRLFSFKQKNIKKKKFKYAVILYDTIFENDSDKKNFLKSRIFKLIDKDNSILVNEIDRIPKWVGKVNEKGYYAVDFNKIHKSIDTKTYFKKYYLSDFLFKNKLILQSFFHPYLISSLFQTMKYRVLWNMFYTKYSIILCKSFMTQVPLSSNVVHKKNKTKTIFTYFSSTEPLLINPVANSPVSYDYSYMIYDYIISSKLSNDNFNLSQSAIGSYINIGPIYSDLIIEAKKNLNIIKNKNYINSYEKIITCFDNTFGYGGTQSKLEYLNYLDAIGNACNNYKNFLFLFKNKKKFEDINSFLGTDGEILIKKIKSYKNFKIAEELDITTYELIGVSELIVTVPLSSIIYESLAGKVKTIIYDSDKKSAKLGTPSAKFPNINSSNSSNFIQCLNHWLNEVSKIDFEKYLENNIEGLVNISNNNFEFFLINRYNQTIKKILNNLN